MLFPVYYSLHIVPWVLFPAYYSLGNVPSVLTPVPSVLIPGFSPLRVHSWGLSLDVELLFIDFIPRGTQGDYLEFLFFDVKMKINTSVRRRLKVRTKHSLKISTKLIKN